MWMILTVCLFCSMGSEQRWDDLAFGFTYFTDDTSYSEVPDCNITSVRKPTRDYVRDQINHGTNQRFV